MLELITIATVGEGVLIGLATNMATKLIECTSRRVRRAMEVEARKAALIRATETALAQTFEQLIGDHEHLEHYLQLFGEWAEQDAVMDELYQLIEPGPQTQLDIEFLGEQFKALGYEPDRLGDVEFREVIRHFIGAFYHAVEGESELKGIIEVRLLRNIAERARAIEAASERTALALESHTEPIERTADAVEDLRVRFDEFLIMMQHAMDYPKRFHALEATTTELRRIGYQVGFDEAGQAQISGEALEGVVDIGYPLLRQLTSAITRLRHAIVEYEPSDEELDALEERYREHLIRWFEHLTFRGMMRTARVMSLPLEDVYVELRAVAEVPEEADVFSVEERHLLLELDESDPKAREELLR